MLTSLSVEGSYFKDCPDFESFWRGTTMTDTETTVAGPTMSDINATVGELLQHVDDVRDPTEHGP